MRERIFCQAAVLLMLMITATVTLAQSQTVAAEYEHVEITAEKMCCKGCAQKVSSHLYALKGVKSVSVDLSNRTVKVSLPNPNASTLGQVWHAVEQGDGGPALLQTSNASYQLRRPENEEEVRLTQQMRATQHLLIEDLHCQGCAEKIAAQLYALKGVTKVSVDMQNNTLIVESDPKNPISAWQMMDAASAAEERAIGVRGKYGLIAIEWAKEASPKSHQQSQYPVNGGIQR